MATKLEKKPSASTETALTNSAQGNEDTHDENATRTRIVLAVTAEQKAKHSARACKDYVSKLWDAKQSEIWDLNAQLEDACENYFFTIRMYPNFSSDYAIRGSMTKVFRKGNTGIDTITD